MDHLRTEIWDHVYRSGPQTVEQIAGSLSLAVETVATEVEHEWFDVVDLKVQIATGRPQGTTGISNVTP